MRAWVAFGVMVMVCLIVLMVYMGALVVTGMVTQLQEIDSNVQRLQEWQGEVGSGAELEQQGELLDGIEQKVDDLGEDVQSLIDIFSGAIVDEFMLTAYAPLCPDAVEGMDYSGDPNKTTSGLPPVPGETVAAGKGIPMGSRVWIEGLGWRTVNDRGG